MTVMIYVVMVAVAMAAIATIETMEKNPTVIIRIITEEMPIDSAIPMGAVTTMMIAMDVLPKAD
jgi:hypothetical protein